MRDSDFSTFADGSDCKECVSAERKIKHLTARLAEAVAAARFYARYYDGPSEALLGEADRKAFQWIERAEKAGGWE